MAKVEDSWDFVKLEAENRCEGSESGSMQNQMTASKNPIVIWRRANALNWYIPFKRQMISFLLTNRTK